jgi:hypothetical protein
MPQEEEKLEKETNLYSGLDPNHWRFVVVVVVIIHEVYLGQNNKETMRVPSPSTGITTQSPSRLIKA